MFPTNIGWRIQYVSNKYWLENTICLKQILVGEYIMSQANIGWRIQYVSKQILVGEYNMSQANIGW